MMPTASWTVGTWRSTIAPMTVAKTGAAASLPVPVG
jgi:hypothetical protein